MGNIICIDLALTNTGWAVANLAEGKDNLHKVGVIRTLPSSTKTAKAHKQTVGEMDWARAEKLARELRSVFALNDILHVYVECPTGGSKSSRAAKAMALAKGAAAAVCASMGLQATLFTPQRAKRAATGSNNATKDEVKVAMLKEFSYYDGWIKNSKGQLVKGQNEHIFDACSVLMCARRTVSYKDISNHE